MTWHADQTNGRPEGQEKLQLLVERDRLEKQLHDLKSSTLSKSAAASRGRQEDLLEIARKMVLIDKKLGRA